MWAEYTTDNSSIAEGLLRKRRSLLTTQQTANDHDNADRVDTKGGTVQRSILGCQDSVSGVTAQVKRYKRPKR